MLATAQQTRSSECSRRCRPRQRRGAVLVWFVFIIPLMLMILLALTDFSGASMAKIELRNAVDAAALSAVKTWDRGDLAAAAYDAEAVLNGNIQSSAIMSRAVTESSTQTDLPSIATVITFGSVTAKNGQSVFTPGNLDPMMLVGEGDTLACQRCVMIQKTLNVPSIGGTWLGVSFGPYTVTTESFARICPRQNTPQLVFVDVIASESQP
ncbi:hypothetical protein GC163_17880 [bacterium]|nr:hypothetical protein [bacterium]